MLQQFRRAIGVSIMRGNIELLIAQQTSHHSNDKWTGSGKNRWFKGNDDNGYSTFQNGQAFMYIRWHKRRGSRYSMHRNAI